MQDSIQEGRQHAYNEHERIAELENTPFPPPDNVTRGPGPVQECSRCSQQHSSYFSAHTQTIDAAKHKCTAVYGAIRKDKLLTFIDSNTSDNFAQTL